MTDNYAQKFHHARAWLMGTLVLVFLRALPNLRYLIGRDQATYCVIGQGLLQGKLLYRDFWDNKPPGIFYVYTLIVKTFGPVMWSVGVVDILWLLVFSCCIYYFSRRYLGMAGALLSVIFYAFRHCRQGYLHAAQAEAFLMLCIFAAWFLLLDRRSVYFPLTGAENSATDLSPGGYERGSGWKIARYFSAGLLLGGAFWMKYNAVIFFPFMALLPFVDFRGLDSTQDSNFLGFSRLRLVIPWRDWFGRMLLVSAGAIFALAAVLIGFRISGAWPAMKEVQFEVLPQYGAGALHWNLPFLLFALRRTQDHMGIWWEIMPALALLVAWWRRDLGRILPLTLLAFAGYTATAVQGRFHAYYFETCYPFYSMFWAYLSVKTFEGFMRVQRVFVQRQWNLARGLLWVVFASLVFSLLPEEIARTVQQYKLAAEWWCNPEASYKLYYWQMPTEKIGDQMRVIDYLRANSLPQDQVYVWGTAPLINFLPQRGNPSRFVSNLGLISTWAPESWRQELVNTLEAKPPRYIVVERHDMAASLTFTKLDSEQYLKIYPRLADLLQRDYAPAVNYSDFEIYEFKK